MQDFIINYFEDVKKISDLDAKAIQTVNTLKDAFQNNHYKEVEAAYAALEKQLPHRQNAASFPSQHLSESSCSSA